jgi:GC-rich sequence DNA-binding factor
MREDDDLGEGDDGVFDLLTIFLLFDSHLLDFAEYTSAQTRIALGKKARKVEASRLREEKQDLIADAFVSLLPLLG